MTNSDLNGGDTEEQESGKQSIPGNVLESHEDHDYTNPDHVQLLEEGGCLFSFSCGHELTPYETEMVDNVINLSAFDDEVQDNYVPHFDTKEYDFIEGSYTFLLARCGYLLPGVDANELLASSSFLLSTFNYQQACQPAGTKIWTDYENMEPNNFRITKPIIPYVYSFTVQFRVSALPEDCYSKLGNHVGTRVDGGVLLERTKRSKPPKEDATKKCKSVLLYTDYGNGDTLVTHLTVILQQGLPEVVERVIDSFGAWGLGETCETAWRTRGYLRKIMPSDDGEDLDMFLDAKSNLDDEDETCALNLTDDELVSDGSSKDYPRTEATGAEHNHNNSS